MTKTDKIIYHIGYVGLLITAFCWGWNSDNFRFRNKR